jgi:CheY-like chemotaxis protein
MTEERLMDNLIIAEDEKDILDIYVSMVTGKAKNIHTVRNGIALINRVLKLMKEGEKIDLILLDEKMPFKEGSQALQQILSFRDECKNIKVLIVSGRNSEVGPGRPSSNPKICYLAKPFKEKDLLECINCKATNFEQFCKFKLSEINQPL